MRLSTLARCTAAGTLAAATVVGAAATASASVTAAPHRAHTSLSIRSSHLRVARGGHDLISGKLDSGARPLAGRIVVLERIRAGAHPVVLGARRTGAEGRVRFEVTPSRTQRYELVFAGTRADRATHSGQVRVVVKA